MAEEKVKRLKPLSNTLRVLYSLSGNQCAFPGCTAPLFDSRANFVGQICHIEAAEEGGQRFNPNMTNEQRRKLENLLLMCHPCHIETDKVDEYPVERMQRIKNEHENRFRDVGLLAQRMADSISDASESYTPQKPRNLVRLLNSSGFTYAADEILAMLNDFNHGVEVFARLTPAAKKTFSIALNRSKTPSGFNEGVPTDCIFFSPYELSNAIGWQLTQILHPIRELEQHGLITDFDTDYGKVFVFIPGPSEWNFWHELRDFCHTNGINITQLLESGDFSCLDG